MSDTIAEQSTPRGMRAIRILAVVAATIVVSGGAFVVWRLTTQRAKSAQTAATQDTAKARAPSPRDNQRSAPPAAIADQNTPASRRTDTARNTKPTTKSPVVATAARPEPAVSQPVAQKPPVTTAAPTTPSISTSTGAPQRDAKPVEVTPAPTPAIVSDKARADAAAEADVAHVRETIASYVQAIGAKNMQTLQELFPSMNQQTRDGYNAFFKNVSDLSTQLVGTPTITPHGATSDAEFAYEMKYRDPSRGNVSQRTTFRAKLQRTDQGWIILSLGALQ